VTLLSAARLAIGAIVAKAASAAKRTLILVLEMLLFM
jgi:hypothetical protein